MRLVRSRLGGEIFLLATAATTTFVMVACATGTDGGVILDDDAGSDATTDAPQRDVNVLPGKDSGTPDDDAGPLPGEDSGACTKKVVINELQTRTAAGASDEFVELYNPSTCAVAIGSWKVVYKSSAGNGNGVLHTFNAGQSIAAKAFLLLGTSSFSGQKDATFTAGMADDGQIALQDDTGKNIDAVGYGSSTGPFVEGSAASPPSATQSIGRKVDGVDTDKNNADFKTLSSPSPRTPN